MFLHMYFLQSIMEEEHPKGPSHNNPEEAAKYVKDVNSLLQSFITDIRGFDHNKHLDAYIYILIYSSYIYMCNKYYSLHTHTNFHVVIYTIGNC